MSNLDCSFSLEPYISSAENSFDIIDSENRFTLSGPENSESTALLTGKETDDVIDELMQQNSEYGDSDADRLMPSVKIVSLAIAANVKDLYLGDSLLTSVLLLVLACRIMRVPVVYNDFIKYILRSFVRPIIF